MNAALSSLHLPMIDWCSVVLKLHHEPFPTGKILSVDTDGSVEWASVKRHMAYSGNFRSSIRTVLIFWLPFLLLLMAGWSASILQSQFNSGRSITLELTSSSYPPSHTPEMDAPNRLAGHSISTYVADVGAYACTRKETNSTSGAFLLILIMLIISRTLLQIHTEGNHD